MPSKTDKQLCFYNISYTLPLFIICLSRPLGNEISKLKQKPKQQNKSATENFLDLSYKYAPQIGGVVSRMILSHDDRDHPKAACNTPLKIARLRSSKDDVTVCRFCESTRCAKLNFRKKKIPTRKVDASDVLKIW